MDRKSHLIDLPMVEVWLIPMIFVLILCLIALLDSPSACPASCACGEHNGGALMNRDPVVINSNAN